jgi:hypothetical protein
MKYRCSIELPSTHRVSTDDIYRQLAHKLIRDMPMFELAKVFQFSAVDHEAELNKSTPNGAEPIRLFNSDAIVYMAQIETNTKTTQT